MHREIVCTFKLHIELTENFILLLRVSLHILLFPPAETENQDSPDKDALVNPVRGSLTFSLILF